MSGYLTDAYAISERQQSLGEFGVVLRFTGKKIDYPLWS
jgi:hypothetical protein